MADDQKQTESLLLKFNSSATSNATIVFIYVCTNILSSIGLVFANKLVLSPRYLGWSFVYALTFMHTFAGWACAQFRADRSRPRLPSKSTSPLALAYVVYVVLNYESLRRNTVGFYQLSKICIAPTVLIMQVLAGKQTTLQVVASVVLVCLGVGVATITDPKVVSSPHGLWIGVASIIATASYQLLAGHYQKKLETTSLMLLESYSPLAMCMLSTVSFIFEPWGVSSRAPGTIFGYSYTSGAVVCILMSSVMGVAVNLSRLLVIGATSSLYYSVIGQPLKTVLVLAAGFLFLGENISLVRCAGITLAIVGLLWYNALAKAENSNIKLNSSATQPSPTNSRIEDTQRHQVCYLLHCPARKLKLFMLFTVAIYLLVHIQPGFVAANRLVVQVQYGLSNRLRAVASGLFYAQQYNRNLTVIWEPDVHCNCVFGKLFKISLNNVVVVSSLNSALPSGPGTWLKYDYLDVAQKYVPIDFSTSQPIFVRTAFRLNSTQGGLHVEEEDNLLRTLLFPTPYILKQVLAAQSTLGKPYVGVHIRNTAPSDELGTPAIARIPPSVMHEMEKHRSLSTVVKFHAKMTDMFQQQGPIRFFVAADNPASKSLLSQKLSFPVYYFYNTQCGAWNRSCTCLESAVVDLWVLGGASRILGSYWSSFSETAASLANSLVDYAGFDF